MPVLPAGVAGVLPYDGTNVGAAVPGVSDFTFTSPNNTTPVDSEVTVTGLGIYRSAAFYAKLQGATGGALDIVLKGSSDGGTTWFEIARFAQLAAAAAAIEVTFSISKAGQNLTITTTQSAVGTAPVITANTVKGGDWGDRIKVSAYPGAGTTLGAQQVIKGIFSP